MIIIHVIEQLFNSSFVELLFNLKKKVNNMGIKLCNNLPNHLKNLDNIQLFRKKLKLFYCNAPILYRNIFHMNIYHRKCKCM